MKEAIILTQTHTLYLQSIHHLHKVTAAYCLKGRAFALYWTLFTQIASDRPKIENKNQIFYPDVKKSNNKSQHKICIKRKKTTETFINVKRVISLSSCSCCLNVSASLVPSHHSRLQIHHTSQPKSISSQLMHQRPPHCLSQRKQFCTNAYILMHACLKTNQMWSCSGAAVCLCCMCIC